MNPAPAIRDDFTTAAGITAGTGGFTATGGRLQTTGTGAFCAGGTVAQPGYADQYGEVLVPTQGAGAEIGLLLRADIPNGKAYGVHNIRDNGTIDFLDIRTGWSVWDQANIVVGVPTPPYTMRAEMIGETLYCFINGALAGSLNITPFLVEPFLASGTPGICMYSGSAAANGEIETWEAGPLPPGYVPGSRAFLDGGRATPPRRMRR